MPQEIVEFTNPVHSFASFDDKNGSDLVSFESDGLEIAVAEETSSVEWDDEMLQDLVFAFEACDVDGSGYLGPQELLVVMRVLGGVDHNSGGDVRDLDLGKMETMIAQETVEWNQFQKDSTRAAHLMKLNRKLVANAAKREAKLAAGFASGLNRIHAGGLVKGAAAVGKGVSAGRKGVSAVAHTSANIGKVVASTVGHAAHVQSVPSMFHSSDNERTPDGLMDYPMFVHLLTSGRVNEYLGTDHDDWEDHVHQMRLMKNAWEAVDVDGNGELTREEMRQTAATLLGHMTDAEFTGFWALLLPGTPAPHTPPAIIVLN